MATNTYVALATQTLGSAASSVTFSSIPQGYTDLRIVFNGQTSADADWTMQFNSDTSSLYSCTYIQGYSIAQSNRRTNDNQVYMGYLFASTQSTVTCDVMNYSNATTYKTSISRVANGGTLVQSYVGLWRNTPAAITTLKILCNGGNFTTGSTFTIYGLTAASVGAKATGGTIYQDASYFYHVFSGNGTFTPSQSISADVLVVAGGASGGGQYAGGGGAGGTCYQSARSLTATGYSITVGAGGAAIVNSASNGNAGTNSTFDTITSLGGGAGASWNSSGANGLTGGSGGGGSMGTSSGNTTTGGAATQGSSGGATGYGSAGGGGLRSGSYFLGGGGGGAGTAGGSASGTLAGAGGNGLNTWSSWMTATGLSSDGYIAGGGGGGAEAGTRGAGGLGGGGNGGQDNSGANALANSGSGGGGVGYNATRNSGAGGSGVIIVRYAK